MARLKSLRKGQKKNSTEAGNTAATATPAGEFAPNTAEIDGATEEPDPEITAIEQIECLPLSQPTVPHHPPPN